MSEEARQGERTEGRVLLVSAYASDAGALEMAALDVAREFFGPGARLEIIRDYKIFHQPAGGPGRQFHASVPVREMNGD